MVVFGSVPKDPESESRKGLFFSFEIYATKGSAQVEARYLRQCGRDAVVLPRQIQADNRTAEVWCVVVRQKMKKSKT